MDWMARSLIFIGGFLLIVGLLMLFAGKISIGRLPGDILIKKDGFVFYFPLTTSILLSLFLSLVLWLISRLGS